MNVEQVLKGYSEPHLAGFGYPDTGSVPRICCCWRSFCRRVVLRTARRHCRQWWCRASGPSGPKLHTELPLPSEQRWRAHRTTATAPDPSKHKRESSVWSIYLKTENWLNKVRSYLVRTKPCMMDAPNNLSLIINAL